MGKKSVVRALKKYPVGSDIGSLLTGLSYNRLTSGTPSGWEVHTSDLGKFAAVYNNGEFFLQGVFYSPETVFSDLECMTLILEQRTGNRVANSFSLAAGILVTLGFTGKNVFDAITGRIHNHDPFPYLTTVEASILAGCIAGFALGKMVDVTKSYLTKWHYAQPLSVQAANYNYGRVAEKMLREIDIYQKMHAQVDPQTFLGMMQAQRSL